MGCQVSKHNSSKKLKNYKLEDPSTKQNSEEPIIIINKLQQQQVENNKNSLQTMAAPFSAQQFIVTQLSIIKPKPCFNENSSISQEQSIKQYIQRRKMLSEKNTSLGSVILLAQLRKKAQSSLINKQIANDADSTFKQKNVKKESSDFCQDDNIIDKNSIQALNNPQSAVIIKNRESQKFLQTKTRKNKSTDFSKLFQTQETISVLEKQKENDQDQMPSGTISEYLSQKSSRLSVQMNIAAMSNNSSSLISNSPVFMKNTQSNQYQEEEQGTTQKLESDEKVRNKNTTNTNKNEMSFLQVQKSTISVSNNYNNIVNIKMDKNELNKQTSINTISTSASQGYVFFS